MSIGRHMDQDSRGFGARKPTTSVVKASILSDACLMEELPQLHNITFITPIIPKINRKIIENI